MAGLGKGPSWRSILWEIERRPMCMSLLDSKLFNVDHLAPDIDWLLWGLLLRDPSTMRNTEQFSLFSMFLSFVY